MKPGIANKKLTIASRGSKLALWQAEYVKSLLAKQGVASEILVIKTTGDRIQDRFLHEIGGKGLFVREIEDALAEKKADLAVHSLKDLPAETPAPFQLTAVLKRHLPTDILIWNPRKHYQTTPAPAMIDDKKINAMGPLTIATGSLRRACLLKYASKNIRVEPIRGNVDTRIQKLGDSEWDALILAEASLERLGMLESVKASRLDPAWFTPSSAQGALVIETLKNSAIIPLIAGLGCATTFFHVGIERLVLGRLGGDCTMPFGCYVSKDADTLTADAVILNMAGIPVRARLRWPAIPAKSIEAYAQEIVEELRKNGAEKILTDLGIKSPF
jgi:hydroxymethylbilane synthase